MELRTAFRESKKRKIRDLAKRKDVEDRSDDDDSNPHEGSQRHTKSNVEISPVVVQVCTVLQNDNSKRSTRNLCETKRNTSVDQNDTEDEESKSGPDATLKNSNVDNLDECEEVNNENNTSSFKEVEKILNRKKSSKESKSEFCKKLPDSYDVDNRGPNEESGNEQENLIKQEKGDIMEEKETVDKVRTKRKKLKEKSKYQKMAIKSEKLLENDETEMPTLAILDVRTVVDDDSNSLSSTNTTIKGAVVEKERSEDASNEDSNGSNKSSTPNKVK